MSSYLIDIHSNVLFCRREGEECGAVGRVDCRPFLATALARLGADADGTVMMDDDIETDVLAAQRQGLSGVLVKTSRYLPAHRAASSTPAMSWIPSPTYPPRWANCHERREPPGTGPESCGR